MFGSLDMVFTDCILLNSTFIIAKYYAFTNDLNCTGVKFTM